MTGVENVAFFSWLYATTSMIWRTHNFFSWFILKKSCSVTDFFLSFLLLQKLITTFFPLNCHFCLLLMNRIFYRGNWKDEAVVVVAVAVVAVVVVVVVVVGFAWLDQVRLGYICRRWTWKKKKKKKIRFSVNYIFCHVMTLHRKYLFSKKNFDLIWRFQCLKCLPFWVITCCKNNQVWIWSSKQPVQKPT